MPKQRKIKTVVNSLSSKQYKLMYNELKLLRNDLNTFITNFNEFNDDADIITIKPKFHTIDNKLFEYEQNLFSGWYNKE
jgi:hypothetical protein